MNRKLLPVLIATGVVVFCWAFFRTGAPDIKGLDRPEIKLSTFAASNTPAARRAATERSTESKFKQTDAERKQQARSRRAARRRDREAKSRGTDAAGAATSSIRADNDRNRDGNRSARASRIKRRDTGVRPRTKQEYLRDRARSRRERIESDRISRPGNVRGLDADGREVFDEEELYDEESHLSDAPLEDEEAIITDEEGLYEVPTEE